MITRATIDAATRVTEYAACRPVALNLSVMPTPWVADAGPQLDGARRADAAGDAAALASPPDA